MQRNWLFEALKIYRRLSKLERDELHCLMEKEDNPDKPLQVVVTSRGYAEIQAWNRLYGASAGGIK